MEDKSIDAITLAAELTAAWLSNQNTRVQSEDVPAFLTLMHATLTGLATPPATVEPSEAASEEQFTPAVTARKSLASPDFIVSMIDGKPYKTLTRHLSTNGLTPAQYRERYGLKTDYPMTAPTYSTMRREMAKKIGLGRKPGEKAPPVAGTSKPAPRKRSAKAEPIA